MKKLLLIFITGSLLFSSCEEKQPDNNPPLSDILGIWTIAEINHRACDGLGCVSTTMDFSASGLTFELSEFSASYFPVVNSPSDINSYTLEGYEDNTLKFKDNEGVWDFEVSDYTGSQVTITGVFPSGTPDVIDYDVIFLER